MRTIRSGTSTGSVTVVSDYGDFAHERGLERGLGSKRGGFAHEKKRLFGRLSDRRERTEVVGISRSSSANNSTAPPKKSNAGFW